MLGQSSPVTPGLVRIRRALLSVSDKAGVVDLARALHALGVMLISTGGTARALDAAGIPNTSIESITGLPEMLDGRVKTLHPAVHAGLLAVRDNPAHAAALRAHNIEPIDLVCINLYPFAQTIAKPGTTRDEAIEQIDIGGPSMLRSGAKNHAYVAVVTAPEQYATLIAELHTNAGCTTPKLRAQLAQQAFATTARYDATIADYLSDPTSTPPTAPPAHQTTDNSFPQTLTRTYELAQTLRYGENPHQAAAVYRSPAYAGATVIPNTAGTEQLHGKELSYNNLADAAAALDCVQRLQNPGLLPERRSAAAIIKHANPCGIAVAPSPALAIDRAIAGDPIASFGGILACTTTIDAHAAERLATPGTFLEVIIAPAYTDEALAILKAKSANVRILAVPALAHPSPTTTDLLTLRTIPGGLLLQERDVLPPQPSTWKHAAGPAPNAHTLHAAAILESAVASMASNAVALGCIDGTNSTNAPSTRLLGAGLGQVDRVTACRLAIEKARQFSPDLLASGNAIATSDAFFPFPDGPALLIDAGVKVIVHPGGSKRDNETLDLCNKHNVTCMLTGTRRFKH